MRDLELAVGVRLWYRLTMSIRKGILLLAVSLGFSLFLLSCSSRKDEVVGILKASPSYDSSVPHKHKFGKLLLQESNGRIYALREAEGFYVRDAAGNRLSEPGGQYPIYRDSEYRLTGRIIEIAEARQVLRIDNESTQLWFPTEANALFEVEIMTVNELPKVDHSPIR